MFSKQKHVLSELPKIDDNNAKYISVDYGTLNPTAFLLWGKSKKTADGFVPKRILL